ncbi:MAG: radical SAM protein [Nitrospirota bacterium]
MKTLQVKVCEIFRSIQGESSYAGLPCTFVRLTGCNLRCSYCDTKYAYSEGTDLSEDYIVGEIKNSGLKLVEITGGEPLLQEGVFHLISRLVNCRFKVLVETNGSLSIKEVDSGAVVILDIKTPGSGMSDKMDLSNLDYVKDTDQIKFVVTSREDYEWSKEFIRRYDLSERCKLLMSPVHDVLRPDVLSEWILGDKLMIRLNLQLHKYIFGGTRGK